MDAVEFLKELKRMCKYNKCAECTISSGCAFPYGKAPCDIKNIEEIVSTVSDWSTKHPIKTRKMDFKEKYPKAEYHIDGIGTPIICCKKLGYTDCCPTGKSCVECWNEPVE